MNRPSILQLSSAVKRLGTERAFEVLAKAKALEKKGKDIINLGIGQPDFSTPDNIISAGQKALKDGYHGYTPGNGLLELREAVSEEIYFRYEREINPDRILITPGGKPTMFFAILMFGEPGSEIIYPNPGFPIYESVIKFTGATPIPIIPVEKKNFSFNIEDLVEKINETTRLVIINNPQNPTGGFMDQDEINFLVRELEKFPKVAILSDEIYSKIIFDGKKMPSLLRYESLSDRLIVLDGWSKTYSMTGWRLGWSVWPESLIEYATRFCINDHSCPNAATQIAGIEALKGPQNSIISMVKEFQLRRDFIFKELNSILNISSNLPKGAFYTFPNISETSLSGDEFADKLLNEKGVVVIPGSSFGNQGENYVRISFANSLDNIKQAIVRIKEFVSG